MMTIRSHDQYNTTIYGLDDRYRGSKGNRRVVLMNPEDMLNLQLKTRDRVDISSHFNGTVRNSKHWIVIPYKIPKRNIAAYFPEANELVPLIQLQIFQILLPQSGLFVPSVVKIPLVRRRILTKGYLEFFLSNAKFRRLWAASVVSLLGEWFNTIALFFLILEYSGSEFLLGILFSVRMALFAITQPINGLLADRISRKN